MAATASSSGGLHRQDPYVAALGPGDLPGLTQAWTRIVCPLECLQGLGISSEQAGEHFEVAAQGFVAVERTLRRDPDVVAILPATEEQDSSPKPVDLVLCLLPQQLAESPLPADFLERLHRSAGSLLFAVFGVWTGYSDAPAADSAVQQRLRHHHQRPRDTAHASRFYFRPQSGAPVAEAEQWWRSTFDYRTWFDGPATRRDDYQTALSEALRCLRLEREVAFFMRGGAAVATHLVHAFHVCQTIRREHARKEQDSKWKLTTGKDEFVKGILHFFFHEGKPSKSWPKPVASSKSASMFSSAVATATAFMGPLLTPHFPSPFHQRFDVRSICFRSAANLGRGLWMFGDEDPLPRFYHRASDASQLAGLLGTMVVPEVSATHQYYLDEPLARTSEPLPTVRAIGCVHNTRDDQRGVFVQVFVPNMLPVSFLPDLGEWFLKNLPTFERLGPESHLRQVLEQVFDFNRFQIVYEVAPSGDQCRVLIRGRLNKAQLARQHPLCSEMLDKLVSANIEVTDAEDRFKVLAIRFERGGEQIELEFHVDPNTSELLASHFLSETAAASGAPPAAAASSTGMPKFSCAVGESLHLHFSMSVSFLGFDWNLPSVVLNVERTPADNIGADSSVFTVSIAQIKVTSAIKKLLGLIGFSDLLDDLLRKTRISLLLNADLFITVQVELPRSRIFSAAMSARAQRYYERIDDLFAVGVRIGQALIDDMIKQDRSLRSSAR